MGAEASSSREGVVVIGVVGEPANTALSKNKCTTGGGLGGTKLLVPWSTRSTCTLSSARSPIVHNRSRSYSSCRSKKRGI